MAAAHDITERAFPVTREGHRKLLTKANALKRANKHAWSMFFEQLEAVQELRENLEEIQQPLDTAAAGLPAQVANALDVTLKKFQQLVQELGRSCECPICYKAVKASETNPDLVLTARPCHWPLVSSLGGAEVQILTAGPWAVGVGPSSIACALQRRCPVSTACNGQESTRTESHCEGKAVSHAVRCCSFL